MLILPPFHVTTDFYCLLSARCLLIMVTILLYDCHLGELRSVWWKRILC